MTTNETAGKGEHRLLGTHTAYAGWAKLLIATIRLADGHTVEREIEDHGEARGCTAVQPGAQDSHSGTAAARPGSVRRRSARDARSDRRRD